MKTKEFFIDTETTGRLYTKNGIHEISGFLRIDGEIVETFNYNINVFPCDEFSREVFTPDKDGKTLSHKSIEEIKNSPDPTGAWLDFSKRMFKHINQFEKNDKAFFIGYNAKFDNEMMRNWCRKGFIYTPKDLHKYNERFYFGSMFWNPPIDIMSMAINALKPYRHELVNFKLETVLEYLGFDVDKSEFHGALYDIKMSVKLYDFLNKYQLPFSKPELAVA